MRQTDGSLQLEEPVEKEKKEEASLGACARTLHTSLIDELHSMWHRATIILILRQTNVIKLERVCGSSVCY